MITRTWPYGTRKRIRIQQINCSMTLKFYMVMATHMDDREATFLLISKDEFERIRPKPEQLQIREMEFREGGPTGGHWMILDVATVTAGGER